MGYKFVSIARPRDLVAAAKKKHERPTYFSIFQFLPQLKRFRLGVGARAAAGCTRQGERTRQEEEEEVEEERFGAAESEEEGGKGKERFGEQTFFVLLLVLSFFFNLYRLSSPLEFFKYFFHFC